MDLTLTLKYQEQNDNKAIVLTDTTIDFDNIALVTSTALATGKMYKIATSSGYSFIGAGAIDNIVGTRFVSNTTATITNGTVYEVTAKVTDITAATLSVTVTNPSGAISNKNSIDVYTLIDGPITLQSEMIYTITPALLGDVAGSLLVDGLYTLTYSLTSKVGGVGISNINVLSVTILVYGQVKVATYQKLRQIPSLYICNDARVKSIISEADLCGAYLTGIENSAYIAKTEELLNMLIELNSMVLNGSNITW